ncbi:MAG: nucleotidyl transferase AbiEii/AbiGii toxin family protein [Methylococcaceae bacterium]
MIEPKNFDCLPAATKSVLLELIDTAPFLHKYVFVGGSALTLYLCHRQSEDIDFFTYADNFDRLEILKYIKRFEHKEILNDNGNQLDLLLCGVKVTFFNANWAFLKPDKPDKFNIATLKSIAILKVNVLFLRAKYRDYYDLYFLVKEVISIRVLFESSKQIIAGITYKLFCIALLYIDDIEDDNIAHLQPKELISKAAIRDFFQNKL